MPRVLWLAPTLNPDPLSRLVEGLSDMAKRRGIPLDERPYNSHLTIARKVRDFEGAAVFKPVKWLVGEFRLLESKSLKSGVVYVPLAAWPLTAASPPVDR
ncbi:MAG TPA: 2'-5' RNA ligase family protein [Gammaproteobacteria bacterium]|nr:2'-5' RNA ligase family protein [Gammaproteobacteria bacterium]